MLHRPLSKAVVVASLVIAGCGGADPIAVRSAVTEYINNEQFVYVTDPRSGETLQMDVASVQVPEAVEDTTGGRALIHVTFRAEDGATYDVDYYVRPVEGGGYRVDDVVMHRAGTEEVLLASDRERLDAQQ
jgi:hypothetical protein